jgi:NAD(P)H dehydrogenase (quinone)
MATGKPKILITGATGQVGREVLKRLTDDKALDVAASSRAPAKAADFGVPVVLLDYDRRETIAPALEGVDRLFSLTAYTVDMLRQSKALVDRARKSGVKHIVHLGACGADDTDVAHYGWHQFVERYITGSGIEFTHLRPEIFMQNLLGYGGVRVVENGVIRHYVGHARLSWIDAEDIAEVAAAVLRDPGAHKGQTYRLGYDAKTFDEIAKIFTQVIGQPFSYEPRPPKEVLDKVLSAGGEPAYMDCVYDSYRRLSGEGVPGSDETFDNFTPITGRQPNTLADFARKHASRFKY